LGIKRG